MSLPVRKCGLKYGIVLDIYSKHTVTSLAEVWIEIGYFGLIQQRLYVTSLAEVWIEIDLRHHHSGRSRSLPLRKCGLKLQ